MFCSWPDVPLKFSFYSRDKCNLSTKPYLLFKKLVYGVIFASASDVISNLYTKIIVP
ncbi:hypothetical protein TBC1_111906 [Lentimicrobium saccharophilum]|uniref:Uncharacterized protein n=1 Tax=Lentimicrobium saccharophilum TaxID=1678841 RepID=A0A0S7C1Y3_9BACT|nr:hypothetical protein TBC1_111906 [Lentimicrobium saccharophilum]